MIRGLAFLCLLFAGGPATAMDFSLPAGSRLISDRPSTFDSYELPVEPYADGQVETRLLEGRVDRQSWRVDSAAITTLQLLDPLRQQLDDAGFETVFDCNAQACGGFDFRFAIEVIPTPDMFVDIRDFRFVAAQSGDEAVSVLVSRSRTAGYVQIVQVGPPENGRLDVASDGEEIQTAADDAGDLSARLREFGHVVLADLVFATGTEDLDGAEYASLQELAEFMAAFPEAQIALVGHTDATGALDLNVDLSRQRAQTVRARLTERHGVAEDRIEAEGMGYLSPRASNLTQAGRERNRRVEAVLLFLE